VTIDDSTFSDNLRIDTGRDNDLLAIETLGDPDAITGTPLVVGGNLDVNLKAGDDAVTLGVDGEPGNSLTVGGLATLDAGSGTDSLVNLGNDFLTDPVLKGFVGL
jgi:hypothetical protein